MSNSSSYFSDDLGLDLLFVLIILLNGKLVPSDELFFYSLSLNPTLNPESTTKFSSLP